MFYQKIILLLFTFIQSIETYTLPYHHWHCIDFVKNIDTTAPYAFNVGDLSLISWFNKTSSPNTIVNACKHMGVKMNYGRVVDNCLVCPYHKVSHDNKMIFGKTLTKDDKIWWSYEPDVKSPPDIPFKFDKTFEISMFTIKLDINFKEVICDIFDTNNIYNIHKTFIGKTPNNLLLNYKHINFNNGLVIKYDYNIQNNIKLFTKDLRSVSVYQTYVYPYTVNNIFRINDKDILTLNINTLPLSDNKSKLVITIKHNFWKSYFQKKNINFLIKRLLNKDINTVSQMHNYNAQETHMNIINSMLKNYTYPDYDSIDKLYNHIRSTTY